MNKNDTQRTVKNHVKASLEKYDSIILRQIHWFDCRFWKTSETLLFLKPEKHFSST